MSALAPGQVVRVRDDWPEARGPVHIRTPHYVRGRTGTIRSILGRFPNPEDLAFARPAPSLTLYHVAFDPASLWGDAKAGDEILVEIYESWLEAA
jgi:nitrile hydratase subunit beta